MFALLLVEAMQDGHSPPIAVIRGLAIAFFLFVVLAVTELIVPLTE